MDWQIPTPLVSEKYLYGTEHNGLWLRTGVFQHEHSTNGDWGGDADNHIGWGSDQGIGGFGEEPGIKAQLTNLIRSVRTVMRVPLIAVNSITIVLLLLFG
nr:PREDICTED: immediate early response 3-interacting protein 1 [Opisthocomus hoazin]